MNKTKPTPRIKRHQRTRILPGETYPSHLVAMYDYMEKYMAKFRYAPSNRELTGEPTKSGFAGNDFPFPESHPKGFATSTSVIRYYLTLMQEFGMIERDPKISRGIRLIPRADWKKHATATPTPVVVEIQHATA